MQILDIIPTYFKFDSLHLVAKLSRICGVRRGVPRILKFGGELPISGHQLSTPKLSYYSSEPAQGLVNSGTVPSFIALSGNVTVQLSTLRGSGRRYP